MALLICDAEAPGFKVAHSVVRFGIPPATPAWDQSVARETLRIPDHGWAWTTPGVMRRRPPKSHAIGRPAAHGRFGGRRRNGVAVSSEVWGWPWSSCARPRRVRLDIRQLLCLINDPPSAAPGGMLTFPECSRSGYLGGRAAERASTYAPGHRIAAHPSHQSPTAGHQRQHL